MEDRYIVLCYCHVHRENKQAKHQETRNKNQNQHQTQTKHKPTKTKANKQKQHTPQSSDVTELQFMGEKDRVKARGDSLVSSRCMHMTTCVPCRRRPMRNKTTTRPATIKSQWATSEGVGSNKAQCGNQGSPQPGSPRSQRAAFTA